MAIHEQSARNVGAEIKHYTPPQLYTGKCWYVGFMAYDPVKGEMRRKRIKVNSIKKIGERRKYAQGLINRLNAQLLQGWNPWVEAESERAYHRWDDVVAQYRRSIDKLFSDGYYREETYRSYMSYLRVLVNWNESRKVPLVYIYQFDSAVVQEFLEYVYVERSNSPQTRDNYLMWLRTWDTWLIQRKYMKSKATAGIVVYGKRVRGKKNRTVIDEKDMMRLKDYLVEKNRHYLLACYVLYYCFIRPKEMSKIRVEHISLKRQTVYIPADNSKNRDDGTVTLPRKVAELMIELGVFDSPGSWFLFSDGFRPGEKFRDSKMYRDYWSTRVRKDLRFPVKYKFYSLKDTGITEMLRRHKSITVRDQARHSSVLTTELYTPKELQEADVFIKNHETEF